MKFLRTILALALTGNALFLYSQSSPVSIDLKSNGAKLDAQLYPAAGRNNL